MIKNYLKVAVRNLRKHQGYTFVNILGLAVGIAASVLIFLYTANEQSYDKFHEKAERTYRITADWSNKGESRIHQLGTPFILAQTIRDKYPQVEAVTQITGPLGDVIIRNQDIVFKETDVFCAEPSFFDVFSFPLIKGSPEISLKEPNALVLTRSLTQKYFRHEDPLGKTIEMQALGKKVLFKVTGVMEDIPENSHFRFDILISMKTIYPQPSLGWTWNNYTTYVTLQKGVTEELMEEKLVEIDKLYCEGGSEHIPWVWTLEPITRIHLHSDLVTGNQPNGSVTYIRIFSVVAVLVLLIAGINFVNLATARSARRAKEVGLRKVVGSLRRHLIQQFLGESVLMSLIALVFAVILILTTLPLYRSLTGKILSLSYFKNPFVFPGLLALSLLMGILAGLYPALFLSSFKLTDVLKGSSFSRKGHGMLSLRNGLVVFQFTMSVLLIIGSLVIFRQLDYIKNKRLGFDKEHVVVIHNADTLEGRLEAYSQKLKQSSEVTGVTAVRSIPGRGTPNWGIGVEGVDRQRPLNMNFLTCDQDFAETLNIRMIEGRFMSREIPSDKEAVVINKKAAEYFGIPEPVGKKLRIWWTRKNLTIIGIIDNFHFEPLHRDVRAMGYLLTEAIDSTRKPFLLVKINSQDTSSVLSYLRKTWESVSAGLPFEFSFLDEKVDSLYQNDNRAGRIVTLFSCLAIFVSCLGLFGLAAFMAEQRTKEIGIRKILGAPLSHIMWLLTGRFIKWVMIANVIAWPLGYWIMNRWLHGFAFRTSLPIWIFLVSGTAALVIAVLTVSSQVVKSSLTNPAQSLKYE
ncbi:MAG: ABC transporter permease [Candidatus Aminicenantes bacterium]|nr:ABC transporter permease [Candidatus Aminicenantes bacterium]